MIPDKIYIHETIHLGLLSASEIDITGQDEQYIRKDTLLKFLASLEKDSARNAESDDLAYAAHEMVCMLIDKIKSL